MGGYKADVTQAMKISSLKGLPRIFSAPNTHLRILWTAAFFIFLGICLWTASYSIIAYFQSQIVINVQDRVINRNDPRATVPFPTIAVCNLNQFGSNASVFEEHGIPLPEIYFKKVRELTTCEDCTTETRNCTASMKRQLMTNRGYYQHVGREAIGKIGDLDLVLMCQVLVSSGLSAVAYPCEKWIRSYFFMHPESGFCKAYQPQSHNLEVIGYSFIFHLDNSLDNVNSEYDPLLFPQEKSAVRFYAMVPDFVPNIFAGTALAGPGQATILDLKITRTDKLPKPFSQRDCTQDEGKKFLFKGRLYDYDYTTCMGRCSVAVVEEICNCTDLFLLQSPFSDKPKYEYCGSVSQSAKDLYKNMYCAESAKEAASLTCKERCKEPCKDIRYTMTPGTTKWPLPSQIGSFYAKIIQEKPALFKKYKKYEDVAKAMAARSENVSELDKLLISKAIEDNFAHVSVFLSDMYYSHHEFQQKTSLNDLISQLGGSLNLWSGITAVLLVEIADLMLRIVARMTRTGKSVTISKEASEPSYKDPPVDKKTKLDEKNIKV